MLVWPSASFNAGTVISSMACNSCLSQLEPKLLWCLQLEEPYSWVVDGSEFYGNNKSRCAAVPLTHFHLSVLAWRQLVGAMWDWASICCRERNTEIPSPPHSFWSVTATPINAFWWAEQPLGPCTVLLQDADLCNESVCLLLVCSYSLCWKQACCGVSSALEHCTVFQGRQHLPHQHCGSGAR